MKPEYRKLLKPNPLFPSRWLEYTLTALMVTMVLSPFLYFVVLPPFLFQRPEASKHFLEVQGYTEVRMTGFDYFACGRGDVIQDGFEATNLVGNEVTGVVCGSFFGKATTIRLY